MPHVTVKLWPGKSEQQKARLAEAIAKDVMEILHYGEESVSVTMLRGIDLSRMHPLRYARRWPLVGTAYTAMLVGGYIWWVLQPPGRRAWVLAASSTNLAHLEHVPWRVLPASSIWSGNPIGWWVVASLLCLGALEIVRVGLFPSWWHELQACVFIVESHCA